MGTRPAEDLTVAGRPYAELCHPGQASTVITTELSGGSVIKEHHFVDVFISVDVGKSNHHAVAIDRNGRKPLDKALPQDEAHLRTIIGDLAAHGTLLLIVGHRRPSASFRS